MSVKSSGPAGTVEIPDPIAWTCGGCKAESIAVRDEVITHQRKQIEEARRLLRYCVMQWMASVEHRRKIERWLRRNAK